MDVSVDLWTEVDRYVPESRRYLHPVPEFSANAGAGEPFLSTTCGGWGGGCAWGMPEFASCHSPAVNA